MDPINPGAVDEILNMGENWNEEGFKKFRKNIIDTNKEIGKIFRRAYRFFATAFTPNGVVTYVDTIVKDYEKVYVLNGGTEKKLR